MTTTVKVEVENLETEQFQHDIHSRGPFGGMTV
jgi:hypothetical protein